MKKFGIGLAVLASLLLPGAAPDPGANPGSLWLIGPGGIVRGEFLPPDDTAQLTAKFLKTRIGR